MRTTAKWLLALVFVSSCSAEGMEGDGGTRPNCTPGTTQACLCVGGGMGVQSCNAAGSGYEPCMCPDAGPPTGPDASRDSGGPVAPRCGDGLCNGTETCTDCPSDCGACPDCRPCTGPSDCSGICGGRTCDGVRGCYASMSSVCPTIGGISCPAVSNYDRCTSVTDCGPYADCASVLTGSTTVCRRRCVSQNDCPPAPQGSNAIQVCASDGRCFLGCSTGTETCPYRMSCTPFQAGMTIGYCR